MERLSKVSPWSSHLVRGVIFRHGHGKMVYKDRRVYEGEWNRDRRHGFGTLTYPGSKGKVFKIHLTSLSKGKVLS